MRTRVSWAWSFRCAIATMSKRPSTRRIFFFQAQGNGVGLKVAPELIGFGKKIVDVPADFRLKDASLYKQHYGAEHTAPDLLEQSVYGLSELHPAEIAAASLIANPGCHATGAILALAPLVTSKAVDLDSIIVDSKSGVSGQGRSKIDLASIFTEINEGFKAYAVGTHRHTPEMEQELSAISGVSVRLSFVPHLVPMNRGILITAYATAGPAAKSMTTADLVAMYREFYAGKPFIAVLDEGKQPNTKNVSARTSAI